MTQKKAIEKYLQSEKNISQNVLTILEKAKNQPRKAVTVYKNA